MVRVVLVCCAIALLVAPAFAGADPGHAIGQPHMGQPPEPDRGGGGGSGLVIGATLVTLLVLAGSAAALKRAQRR